MATRTSTDLQPIDPAKAYPREVLCQISGLGVSALRQAARKGELTQFFCAGRCFIIGADFISWLQEYGKPHKD